MFNRLLRVTMHPSGTSLSAILLLGTYFQYASVVGRPPPRAAGA
jgi:hypothetical protein